MSKYTGVVKWFDNGRGYGFISVNNGTDAYVHHLQIKEKTHDKDLHEGEEVAFDMIEKDKGLMAINVQKI